MLKLFNIKNSLSLTRSRSLFRILYLQSAFSFVLLHKVIILFIRIIIIMTIVGGNVNVEHNVYKM